MVTSDVTTTIPGQIDLIEDVIASFPDKGKILDLGAGAGLASRRFHEEGWDVTTTGFDMAAYLGDGSLPDGITVVQDVDICDAHPFEDASFDAIWCAHVLEHVSNTGLALTELRRLLKPDGKLFIAVPPFKHKVVGGHVTNGWNLGTLMYVLADAGFGLAEARFIQHGYNVFGVVDRGLGPLPGGSLRRANGDIETLAEAGRFPNGFAAKQGFNGLRKSVNWLWHKAPEAIPVARKDLLAPPAISQMRIGFFVPWITLGRGGTENVGHMMANAMAKRGHKVTIFTFDDNAGPSLWPLSDEIALVHLPSAAGEVADQRMAVEVSIRNLDLLVGLHMNRTMLRYVRCAHKTGLPLVLSEHIDPRFPKWIGKFSEDERDVAMAGATLVHLLIEDFVQTLDSSIRGKARVIANTIPEPTVLADPGGEKTQRTLLAVSRLVPRKNQAFTIEAFAKVAPEFPEWRLQLVGDGQLLASLKAKADSLGIAERVEFVGEHDDVYPFYAAADLFVIPSQFEGFPLTLCEAMAHGLPSVGFGVCGGVKAQITSGQNGILCDGVGTSDALAEAFRTLMADDALRASQGQAAHDDFMSRFSNETIHSEWEEMFAEAVEMPVRLKQPDHASLTAVRLWEQVWGPIKKNDAV